MKRPALLVFLGAVLCSVPLSAQITGRWKLTLDNGGTTNRQAELVLSDSTGNAAGALLLETRDSVWIPLHDLRLEARTLQFSVAAGEPLRFEGRLVGEELEGSVSAQGARRFRWRGVRLTAHEEYYASLPRFRQRQIRVGSVAPHFTIPGKWLAAAATLGETHAVVTAGYTELAQRAQLAPLTRDSLASFGLLRAMGLFRRAELRDAVVRALEKVRFNLTTDSGRARFDHVFRPAGRWQVDVHDVALARAQRPFPTISWESARPALEGGKLLESDAGDIAAIPLALYRLFVLSQSDSGDFRTREQGLRRADAASAAAVLALLNGYGEASQWYVAALQFLLEQRWVKTPGGVQSPAELVRRRWNLAAPVPQIMARPYGYPEGAVRIGIDSQLAAAVVSAENASARDWMTRHDLQSLITVLHQLSLPYNPTTRLNVAGRLFRLSSIQEYARESFNGFLEPRDVILLDPSYQPLLALGTLIHEWQHILHERVRQQSGLSHRAEGDEILLTQVDPFLAEGIAEWLTDDILAPAVVEFPLVIFGEAEKRVSLTQNDPHQLGYLMVRSLTRALGDSAALVLLLTANDPEMIMADPRVRRSWASHRGPDRRIPRRGEEILLPRVVFTIEDEYPDLVQSQILAPYIPRP